MNNHTPHNSSTHRHIVFFDGLCQYCNFWVQKLLIYDKREILKFCPLQSPRAQDFLGKIENHPDSIIYWRRGHILYKSQALLAITWDIGGVWKLFSIFKIVPRTWLDGLYDIIARHRYSWFGSKFDSKKTCPLPPPPTDKQQSRFLSTNSHTRPQKPPPPSL